MNQSFRFCVAAFLLVGGMVHETSAQESLRIAFLDMERVFTEYEKTRKADTRLKEQAAEVNEERSVMIEQLREREEVFNTLREEAQDPSLSDAARERKRSEAEEQLNEVRQKENEIRNFEELKRKDLEDQGRRMRKRIVAEINSVIETYAKDHSLFSVVDSSGTSLNQVPVFLYTDRQFDVTDEIIGLLNRGQDVEEEDVDTEDAPGAR